MMQNETAIDTMYVLCSSMCTSQCYIVLQALYEKKQFIINDELNDRENAALIFFIYIYVCMTTTDLESTTMSGYYGKWQPSSTSCFSCCAVVGMVVIVGATVPPRRHYLSRTRRSAHPSRHHHQKWRQRISFIERVCGLRTCLCVCMCVSFHVLPFDFYFHFPAQTEVGPCIVLTAISTQTARCPSDLLC